MNTTKKTWIAGLAAGLLTGGGVAMVATLPGGAGASTSPAIEQAADDSATTDTGTDTTADDSRPDRGQWVTDALAPLVEDGTITQAQADAVVAALETARPDGGMGGGHGGPMMGAGLDAVATELGITTEEIQTALQDGQSLADIATANGSSAQAVIDVLVADLTAHLDEEVAAGEHTQEEADARLADATERITAMVNGEMPAGGPAWADPVWVATARVWAATRACPVCPVRPPTARPTPRRPAADRRGSAPPHRTRQPRHACVAPSPSLGATFASAPAHSSARRQRLCLRISTTWLE